MDEHKRHEIKKLFCHLNDDMIDSIIDETIVRIHDRPTVDNVKFGKTVKIQNKQLVNLYLCEIGDNTQIGNFVEIQKDVKIGNNCKIQSHSFICSNVTLGDFCFIGHGVMFINDKYPQVDIYLPLKNTIIGNRVSIGSNATILGDITIGNNVIIGAGSVVTKNIPDNQIWAGNPARQIIK